MNKVIRNGRKYKKNMFTNKHYGAPLLSLYIQNKDGYTYTYSDIKSYIKAVEWSNVLKERLLGNKIIEYEKKGIVKGGKHKFKFDRDEFIFWLTKGFIKFCAEQLVKDMKNNIFGWLKNSEYAKKELDEWWINSKPLRRINKNQVLKIKGKIPQKKKDAIFNIFLRMQDELILPDEMLELQEKERELRTKLNNIYFDEEGIPKEVHFLLRELTKTVKLYGKKMREYINNKWGKGILEIKSFYSNEVMLNYQETIESMRTIDIIKFMDRIVSESVKGVNLNKKLSLYQFFYSMIREMAIVYHNDKALLKEYGEHSEKILTICNWAYKYHMLGGKYD